MSTALVPKLLSPASERYSDKECLFFHFPLNYNFVIERYILTPIPNALAGVPRRSEVIV